MGLEDGRQHGGSGCGADIGLRHGLGAQKESDAKKSRTIVRLLLCEDTQI